VRTIAFLAIAAALVVAVVGCALGAPGATPPIRPGSSTAPRDVNVILKDRVFLPDPVDVIPGETVMLHVINGGLEIHEVVIGDQLIQEAWETAEAAVADPPPGPTPLVTVPADRTGVRIVVASGQRVDVTWAVPADSAVVAGLVLGCHIPGHWAAGMRAGIRIGTVGP
jgi:uncharacterized cupredoxin-like copper-binding protein